MPRFVIERDIPEIGKADQAALRGAARNSNEVIAGMKLKSQNIQWEHSYVTENRIYCVYIADTAEEIRQHAEQSGIPANTINPVVAVLDPTTAEG